MVWGPSRGNMEHKTGYARQSELIGGNMETENRTDNPDEHMDDMRVEFERLMQEPPVEVPIRFTLPAGMRGFVIQAPDSWVRVASGKEGREKGHGEEA